MNIQFRQFLITAIQGIKEDFCILWKLRHTNPVRHPLLVLVNKMRALRELLKSYPEIKCPHCEKSIN